MINEQKPTKSNKTFRSEYERVISIQTEKNPVAQVMQKS